MRTIEERYRFLVSRLLVEDPDYWEGDAMLTMKSFCFGFSTVNPDHLKDMDRVVDFAIESEEFDGRYKDNGIKPPSTSDISAQCEPSENDIVISVMTAELERNRAVIAELLGVLKEYVTDSHEHDVGGGDVVVATCESRIAAVNAIAKYAPRCPHCDGTGDVHRVDGEWLGECSCVENRVNESDALVHVSDRGEGQENECIVCGAEPGHPCSGEDQNTSESGLGVEYSTRVHHARLL